MGFKMEIDGLKIGGDVELLNGATIHSVEGEYIKLKNLDIRGKLSMMNDIEIKSLISELEEESLNMNQNVREYKEIQAILRAKHRKKEFIERVGKHLTVKKCGDTYFFSGIATNLADFYNPQVHGRFYPYGCRCRLSYTA